MSTVFTGKGVTSLFDQKWHKMVLSVQSQGVSVHIDCSYISAKPLEPWRAVAGEGNTFIGLDAMQGTPVQVGHRAWVLKGPVWAGRAGARERKAVRGCACAHMCHGPIACSKRE